MPLSRCAATVYAPKTPFGEKNLPRQFRNQGRTARPFSPNGAAMEAHRPRHRATIAAPFGLNGGQGIANRRQR